MTLEFASIYCMRQLMKINGWRDAGLCFFMKPSHIQELCGQFSHFPLRGLASLNRLTPSMSVVRTQDNAASSLGSSGNLSMWVNGLPAWPQPSPGMIPTPLPSLNSNIKTVTKVTKAEHPRNIVTGRQLVMKWVEGLVCERILISQN